RPSEMPPGFIAPAAGADRDKGQSVCSRGRTAGRLRVESEHVTLPDRHFLPVDRVRARAANDHVDFLLARIALVVDSPAEVGRQLEPVDPASTPSSRRTNRTAPPGPAGSISCTLTFE